MTRMRSRRHLLLALLAVPLSACAAAPLDERVLALGRQLSEQFERGDVAAVYARTAPPLRDTLGGPAGLAQRRERMLREDGPETGLIGEETRVEGTHRIYRRIARRNVGEMPTLMEWTLDPQGRAVALEIRREAVAIPSGKAAY